MEILKSVRWLFKQGIFSVNILLSSVTLLAYLAPHISPETFVLPSFLGLGYPILLSLHLLFIIFWTAMFKKQVWLSIIVVLLGWGHLEGIFGFSGNGIPPQGALKVMSFNAHYFDCLENTKNRELRDEVVGNILDFIKKENPDILCAQEFTGDINPVTNRINAFMRAEMGMKYSYSAGTATTFSKIKFEQPGYLDFEHTDNTAVFVELTLKGKKIRVYNLHLQSIALGKAADKVLDEKELSKLPDGQSSVFYQTVFGKIGRAFVRRAVQADKIKAHMNAYDGNIIVCGDFNDTPSSYTYETISEDLKDSFLECGRGIGSTYRGRLPFLRIDYLLASEGLEVHTHKIHKNHFSDHFAVSSELTFAK